MDKQWINLYHNLKISELNVSERAIHTMERMGFHHASDLEGYDFYSLLEQFREIYCLGEIVNEFMNIGYLLPSCKEICIYDIPMSVRLRNILERNNILFLSQFEKIPREKVMRYRNLGAATMLELENICSVYGIQMPSLNPVIQQLSQYGIPNEFADIFFTYKE